jgi:hypothetical protein
VLLVEFVFAKLMLVELVLASRTLVGCPAAPEVHRFSILHLFDAHCRLKSQQTPSFRCLVRKRARGHFDWQMPFSQNAVWHSLSERQQEPTSPVELEMHFVLHRPTVAVEIPPNGICRQKVERHCSFFVQQAPYGP